MNYWSGASRFEGASIGEILAQVEHREPRRPRSIDPRISRDLESICLRCLEKDPTRRFRSAEALAEDIDRWLAGKPVQARSIGPAERSWRWCQRNPLVAGLAGTVAALLIASMIGTVAAFSRIIWEQKATAAALKLAEEQRKKAVIRAEEAQEQRRLVTLKHGTLIQGITEPLKKLADPDLARIPEFAKLRHEIIRVAVRILDETLGPSDEIDGDPDALIHKGLLLTADGDHHGAQEAYREAIQTSEQWTDRDPRRPRAWDTLGMARAHLGMELWEQRLASAAVPELRKAWDEFERAIGLAAPDDLFVFQHAAWFLLLCPDEQLRNPRRGLEFAERIARIASDFERHNPTLLYGVRPLMTLGLARYRCGDWAGARGPVEESIWLRDGGDAYEGFTFAMILGRLGDREAGLARYNEADLWMRRNRFGDFELHFLRDEAAGVLGLSPPPR